MSIHRSSRTEIESNLVERGEYRLNGAPEIWNCNDCNGITGIDPGPANLAHALLESLIIFRHVLMHAAIALNPLHSLSLLYSVARFTAQAPA